GQRTVYVEGFSIDKYEVTNRQYRKFVEATRYPRIPDHWQQNDNRPPPGEEDYPITFVSWYDAKAYAKWAGKRLPTEAEWEKAARGTDGRHYPWGMEFDKGKANTWESWGGSTGQTKAVGTHQGGVSPYGIHDMAGNVMEWTATEIKRYSQTKDGGGGQREELPLVLVRGGGWSSDGVDSSTFSRTITEPYIRSGGVGFRCARSDP
ncbi:MAG: SUMF1/EgtB/PvdO family nonheme iron enzyme, partial [Candidatus Tectomicrobia bacterium]|nr:SUMF1/EgtB/PvdO family nonheme iron enzyme [Candidatus Tectomicrobia bacterium]